jgi:hypothetical protein
LRYAKNAQVAPVIVVVVTDRSEVTARGSQVTATGL